MSLTLTMKALDWLQNLACGYQQYCNSPVCLTQGRSADLGPEHRAQQLPAAGGRSLTAGSPEQRAETEAAGAWRNHQVQVQVHHHQPRGQDCPVGRTARHRVKVRGVLYICFIYCIGFLTATYLLFTAGSVSRPPGWRDAQRRSWKRCWYRSKTRGATRISTKIRLTQSRFTCNFKVIGGLRLPDIWAWFLANVLVPTLTVLRRPKRQIAECVSWNVS